jgi:hypothetical protein
LPGFCFSVMPGRTIANPKIHFATHVHPVAFLAHAESVALDWP